jgi:adenylyl-sulfate kinase
MTRKNGKHGAVVWLTGPPCSGKTTLARLLEKALLQRRVDVEVLDGDEVRQYLSKDLGFSKADRDTNVRRIGYVCHLLSRHGIVAIAALVSPYQLVRNEIRSMCDGRFMEIYLKCPLEVLIQRDAKGLYRKAIIGEIQNFTGISDPYETPLFPELVVPTDQETPDGSVAIILRRLEELGFLQARTQS